MTPSLQMYLPQDYVNYTKISWVDSSGIKHLLYPASKTSNPTKLQQDSTGGYVFSGGSLNDTGESTTWSSYKSGTPSENQDDYQDDTYWPMEGSRYGLDPQYSNGNGWFTINDREGKISFSNGLVDKLIVLEYISDGLAYDLDTRVPKLAEEAMYAHVLHAILSLRANQPEYIINRLKQEKTAKLRNAKIRLSNIKLEEITQVLRGQSKWIKH